MAMECMSYLKTSKNEESLKTSRDMPPLKNVDECGNLIGI